MGPNDGIAVGMLVVLQVGEWSPPNYQFKLLECAGFDIEQPLEIGVHLMLHLVHLPKSKHALNDDAPGLVRAITDHLESNHKGGDG